MMRQSLRLAIAAVALILAACSDDAAAPYGVSSATVVAYVNDTPVTSDQIEFMSGKLGIPAEQLVQQPDAKNKIRQTLINSRAMALLVEGEMDESERQELALSVAAYREELLVHRYLKKHVIPEPVEAQLVDKYYREHLEEFGGGIEKVFEILRAPDDLEDAERNSLIREFSSAVKVKDWNSFASKLGKNVSYRKATVRVEVLDEPIKTLVSTTAPGGISPLNTTKGITVVRVLSEKKLSPRPLAEVSSDIRKRLAPIKLKEAVKKAAEDALAKVEVRKQD